MSATELPNPFTEPAKISGYGRLYAPDPRDRLHPMAAVIPPGSSRNLSKKRWRLGAHQAWRIQRGSTCVGHGITHLRALTPFLGHNLDAEFPYRVYAWAQQNDEWDGAEPSYYGTSVRAGLQYLRKVDGSVTEFHAAATIDDVLKRLASPTKGGGGPLVVGTDFYAGMSPDAPQNGAEPQEWKVEGDYWGGHCYVLIGYDPMTAKTPERVYVGNSHEGNTVGWMTIDALEYLLFQANGDCYAVTETR